jgi:hypothetical protein
MTRETAHKLFKVEVDKNAVNVGISGSPSFVDQEIDHFLNSAYLSKVNTAFTGHNTLQTVFDGSIKRIADLEGLVKFDAGITPVTDTTTNILTITDFKANNGTRDTRLYPIDGILHFSNGSKSAVSKVIGHYDAENFTATYDNLPYIPVPVFTLENNTIRIFVDKQLMPGTYTFDLRYVAHPEDIATSGIISVSDAVAMEIVKIAADMAIENIESTRVQTHPQLTQTYNE